MNELFDFCIKEGKTRPSWHEARLIVIPKIKNNLRFPSTYHTISILNVDYKILSVILANRLGNIAQYYIIKDQTGFIKGRHLRKNIGNVLNIIHKAKIEIIPRLLLYVDAKKAFDYLEGKYLIAVLKKIAMCAGFCNWIQLLYKDQHAVVKLEGQ